MKHFNSYLSLCFLMIVFFANADTSKPFFIEHEIRVIQDDITASSLIIKIVDIAPVFRDSVIEQKIYDFQESEDPA